MISSLSLLELRQRAYLAQHQQRCCQPSLLTAVSDDRQGCGSVASAMCCETQGIPSLYATPVFYVSNGSAKCVDLGCVLVLGQKTGDCNIDKVADSLMLPERYSEEPIVGMELTINVIYSTCS